MQQIYLKKSVGHMEFHSSAKDKLELSFTNVILRDDL